MPLLLFVIDRKKQIKNIDLKRRYKALKANINIL